ncbi:hypothetical protein [Campylobacter sp. CCS1377]|uniref:PLD phosphodiesterase domain-containing protein n=1 Tax=Campylobacter sp. CCS1377 TaxID=3158229 RepID=A0AAU7EA29_9BACT
MKNKEFTCQYIYNLYELRNLIDKYCKQAKNIVLYCNNFSRKNVLNLAISDYEIAKDCYYGLDQYLYDTLKTFASKGKKVQIYDYSYKNFIDSNNSDNNLPNFIITSLSCDMASIFDDFIKALEKSEDETTSEAMTQISKKENKGIDFLITCINEKLKTPILQKLKSFDEYQKLNEYKLNEQIELIFGELIQNIKDIYAEGYEFAYKTIINAFLNIVNIFKLKSFLTKTHPLLIASDIAFESWRVFQDISEWSENKYSYVFYNAIIKLLISDIGYIFTVFENKIHHYTLIIDDKILFDFSGFGAVNFQSSVYHKQDLAICLKSNEEIFKDFWSANSSNFFTENPKEEFILYKQYSIKEALKRQIPLDQNRLSYIESPYFNSIALAQIIKDLKDKKSESYHAKNFLIITNAPQKYNAGLHQKLTEEIFENTIIYPDTIKDEKQNDILVKAPKDYDVTIDYSKYKINIIDNETNAFVLSLSPFVKLNYQTYQSFEDVVKEKEKLLNSITDDNPENVFQYLNFIKNPSNADKIHNYYYLQSVFYQANNKKTFLEKQKQYFQEGIDCLRAYINSIIQTKQQNIGTYTGVTYSEKFVDKKNITITEVLLLALTYYVIKHFYSSIKTDYQAWWKLFANYESIQIEEEESIDILPQDVLLNINEEKIPLCFSKQQKAKLTEKKIFCIEEFVDYLEQSKDCEIDENDEKELEIYLKQDSQDTQTQDEALKHNLEQLDALIKDEKKSSNNISDELDTLTEYIEKNDIDKISYNPQKTIVAMMDAFIDKFFPFADFLRGDDFKFAKQLSKTVLNFLTLEAQKALYENIGASYLLFLMTKSNIHMKKVTIHNQKEFDKRFKKLSKMALLELCYMQKNKNKYEAIMLVDGMTFKELKNRKGFKDLTNISKKQIFRYKFNFTLKTIRNIAKESFIFLPQVIITDLVNQLWITHYEKSKKEYEKLKFLNFSDKYSPPYVLMKKPTDAQEGLISYPMFINNTFISFNFTSMFTGGKLQTGGLGEKESLFVYHKDLSGTKKVRNYLLNKLFAYLCLDELRSKTGDLKIIEDIDFFNTYSYLHDLPTKPRLLKLKHEEDFLIPKNANEEQRRSIETYNKKLQAINKDEAKKALYKEYKNREAKGLAAIDAYHKCMDYLEDIDNDIFNTKATNNASDPSKHREFLKALDTIGQNNIKALYVGINGDKNISQKKESEENKEYMIKVANNKEEKEKCPKFVGRLATTIIMKNGLHIG